MSIKTTQPLVSIVTPSFNAADTIQETIECVLNQTYPNIEYIIMDGGSTDSTLEVLQAYKDRLTYVSEPDKGQSDAINKGWKSSKGDIIAWLCADDLYQPDTVQTAVDALVQNPEFAWVYGHAQHIDKAGSPYPFRNPTLQWNYQGLLEYGNYIIQPTVFLHRKLLDDIGYVRNDLHYTLDYEYWLRIGQNYPALYIPEELAIVRYYPEIKSASGGEKRLAEIEQVVQSYGGKEIPKGFRHDWTRFYLGDSLRSFMKADWANFVQYSQNAMRYPSHIPRAFAKMMLNILPHQVELQLRQTLVREQ